MIHLTLIAYIKTLQITWVLLEVSISCNFLMEIYEDHLQVRKLTIYNMLIVTKYEFKYS